MKKIKTLFKREIVNHRIVGISPEIPEGYEWVINEPCIATRKHDGTAVAIIGGRLYARLDFKNLKSKKLPEGAIACQEEPDSVTGSHPYWVPVAKETITVMNACDFNTKDAVVDMIYKYQFEAFKKLISESNVEHMADLDGSYELCGPHIKSNPEQLEQDTLIRHGSAVLQDVTMTFNGIKEYLENNYIEGIVFYRANGDMAKIKRSDFGLEWRGHQERRTRKKKK